MDLFRGILYFFKGYSSIRYDAKSVMFPGLHKCYCCNVKCPMYEQESYSDICPECDKGCCYRCKKCEQYVPYYTALYHDHARKYGMYIYERYGYD